MRKKTWRKKDALAGSGERKHDEKKLDDKKKTRDENITKTLWKSLCMTKTRRKHYENHNAWLNYNENMTKTWQKSSCMTKT